MNKVHADSAIATNVENNFRASETLMNHMNVNVIYIHLPRTVNFKNTLENNITSS